MKKFAQYFLISTVAAVLALAGTGCSAKAKKAYHLARADKFFTATNWPSAEIVTGFDESPTELNENSR